MKAAVYARVSTTDQEPENQLRELRRYVVARGWAPQEFVDRVSGAVDSRPALKRLLQQARRRRIDVLVVWSLDRLGRSLRHLVELLDELRALQVSLVSLKEGLDLSTPAGRLQWQIIAAISEFERERLRERVRAGLARVKAEGRPGEDADRDWMERAPVPILTARCARDGRLGLRSLVGVLNCR